MAPLGTSAESVALFFLFSAVLLIATSLFAVRICPNSQGTRYNRLDGPISKTSEIIKYPMYDLQEKCVMYELQEKCVESVVLLHNSLLIHRIAQLGAF